MSKEKDQPNTHPLINADYSKIESWLMNEMILSNPAVWIPCLEQAIDFIKKNAPKKKPIGEEPKTDLFDGECTQCLGTGWVVNHSDYGFDIQKCEECGVFKSDEEAARHAALHSRDEAKAKRFAKLLNTLLVTGFAKTEEKWSGTTLFCVRVKEAIESFGEDWSAITRVFNEAQDYFEEHCRK